MKKYVSLQWKIIFYGEKAENENIYFISLILSLCNKYYLVFNVHDCFLLSE